MDAQPTAILAMVDDVVEARPEDIPHNIEGIRRALRGAKPSVVLQKLVVPETTDLVVRYRERIAELQTEVNRLYEERVTLEQTIADLTVRLDAFEPPTPVDGFFTMSQFVGRLLIKLGRSYRWKLSYVEASMAEDCETVTSELIQKWQNTDRVPEWAVRQIDHMVFGRLRGNNGTPWTDEERQFLVDLYNHDPKTRNRTLASLCSAQFGRTITENAIKGEIDRAQKRKTIQSRAVHRAALSIVQH